jgi:hypothetical protein
VSIYAEQSLESVCGSADNELLLLFFSCSSGRFHDSFITTVPHNQQFLNVFLATGFLMSHAWLSLVRFMHDWLSSLGIVPFLLAAGFLVFMFTAAVWP